MPTVRIAVRILLEPDKISKKEWRDFVINHVHGSIFQSPEMFDVYSNTRHYEPIILAVLDDKETIQALLLSVIQKENSGVLGVLSSRAIIIGGPLIAPGKEEILTILLQKYNTIIRKRAIYTQIRNSYSPGETLKHFKGHGYDYVDHLNIILDLRIGKDNLWKNFSRSRKKGIKKAQTKDFAFSFYQDGRYINEFYKLLSVTYNRIKLPIPDVGHFVEISKRYDNSNYSVFTITRNNRVLVALFALIYKKTIYGYYMGSVNDNDIIKEKPIDLLFWEVFKWSIEENLHFFDWMGAGSPGKSYGVRDFKLQYGGELQSFGRIERIHKPIFYFIAKRGLLIWQKIKR